MAVNEYDFRNRDTRNPSVINPLINNECPQESRTKSFGGSLLILFC